MLISLINSNFRIVVILIILMVISTVLVLSIILVMRRLQIIENKKRERFLALWTPLMTMAVNNQRRIWPEVEEGFQIDYLTLWNRFQNNLSNDSQDGLVRMCKDTGMDKVALAMLDSKSVSKQILSAMSMGHLKDKNACEQLTAIANSSNSLAGQVAALSLAKIDPQKAAHCLIPLIPQRPQWSKSSIAAILTILGRKNITLPLIDTINTVDKKDLPRMIGLLPFAEDTAASEAVAELLKENSDIEIISACLKEIKSFADKSWISKVRPYLRHESWIVRVQAVNTLGDLVDINSLADFVAMLSDQNWWVRYRAAQAIVNMPLISREQTEKIISGLDDQFAKDILKQVMTEKKWGDVL